MLSPWHENNIVWTDWFSTFAGVRADVLVFSDHSDTVQNSGNGVAWEPSPKVGAKFGPWDQTNFYIRAGSALARKTFRG